MKLTTFKTILPKHTNWQPYEGGGNVIFGGEAFSLMDLAAAALCRLALAKLGSTCDTAATWKVSDLTFHRPVGAGDIVETRAVITSFDGTGHFANPIKQSHLGGRTIEVKVESFVTCRETGEKKLFATGQFAFVSKKGSKYKDHGLFDRSEFESYNFSV